MMLQEILATQLPKKHAPWSRGTNYHTVVIGRYFNIFVIFVKVVFSHFANTKDYEY